MRSKRICITTYAALLYGKAVETEKLFAKEGELAGWNLRHKDLGRITGIAGILLRIFYFFAALFVKLWRDSYGTTKVEGIYTVLLIHRHHNIIGWLIVNKQFAIAGEYQTSRWKQDIFAKSIGVSILLIVVAKQLQGEQANQINKNDADGYAANHKLTVTIIFVDFQNKR